MSGTCPGPTSVGSDSDRGAPFTPEAYEVRARRFGPNSDVIQRVLLKVLPLDDIVLIREGQGLSTTQEETILLQFLMRVCVCFVCEL